MNPTLDEFNALLRQDLHGFIQRSFYELNPGTEYLPNWHLEVLAAELEKCRRGETKRLIINVPPRSLKSHCASIAFPAFLLGHNPATRIICASYGQHLSETLADGCLSVMASEWYMDLFPGTRLAARRQALGDFKTTRQGFRLSTSVEGGLTGQGADYIIIDDPLKPDEALSEVRRGAVNEWYDHTVFGRLNDKRDGCIILIMQRLHEDDLVGHVQKIDNWRVLKFPAIAEEEESYSIETPYGPRRVGRKAGEALHPKREPLEVLAGVRRSLGEYHFAGQFQQSPSPLGGGLIKSSWFKRYKDGGLPDRFELIFQSWDTAYKAKEQNDYTVCTTWGLKEKKLYLLSVFRRRLEFPELKRAIRDQAADFRPNNILIEDKVSGISLIQELIHEGVHEVTRYVPKSDKIVRLTSITSMIESGFVFLPENAAWLPEYLDELTIFPNGKYDDQADSTAQALDWIRDNLSERYGWLRILARREMIAQGRDEEVREMDKKYGTPPEDPEPPRPSGPAVYTRYRNDPKSGGPVTFDGDKSKDPKK